MRQLRVRSRKKIPPERGKTKYIRYPALTAIVVPPPPAAGAPSVVPTPAATIASGAPPRRGGPRHELHRYLALIELTAVRGVPGPYCIVDRLELHECVIALHVDAHQLAVRLEEHLQVLALRGLLVEVDDEESVVGLDLLAALVLLALDPAVAPREFSTKAVGDMVDVPSRVGSR